LRWRFRLVGPRTSAWWMSRESLVRFRKQSGEVELVGACLAGGFKVGAGPVAGVWREPCVPATGLGAGAGVLVVGRGAGRVAELGPGPSGDGAAAVAISAHDRAGGDQSVAELVHHRELHRLVAARGVDVVANLVGVPHRRAHATDPLVGPDRVQEALERRQLP